MDKKIENEVKEVLIGRRKLKEKTLRKICLNMMFW